MLSVVLCLIFQPFHRHDMEPLISCCFFHTPIAETRKAENRCMGIISTVDDIQCLIYPVYSFFGIFHINGVRENHIIGWRMNFSVRYGDYVVCINSKGVEPEWIYEQLISLNEK